MLIDDNVICIDNKGYEKYLTVGKTYEIINTYIGNVTGKRHCSVYTGLRFPSIVKPFSSHFATTKEYRKLKLNKLNEIICSK